jgi:hypothetical protein
MTRNLFELLFEVDQSRLPRHPRPTLTLLSNEISVMAIMVYLTFLPTHFLISTPYYPRLHISDTRP